MEKVRGGWKRFGPAECAGVVYNASRVILLSFSFLTPLSVHCSNTAEPARGWPQGEEGKRKRVKREEELRMGEHRYEKVEPKEGDC